MVSMPELCSPNPITNTPASRPSNGPCPDRSRPMNEAEAPMAVNTKAKPSTKQAAANTVRRVISGAGQWADISSTDNPLMNEM
jgi:hypothetical protein